MVDKKFLGINSILQHVWLNARLTLNLIASIQEETAESFEKVTAGLAKMGLSSTANKNLAEKDLEKSYLTPDVEQSQKLHRIQDQVDDILESAFQGDSSAPTFIDQSACQYNKSMEAVSLLDKKLSDILFEMMGALSADDVIGQRVTCLSNIIQLQQAFVKQYLDHEKPRMSQSEMNEWTQVLLEKSEHQLKTAEDGRIFTKIFKSPLHAIDGSNENEVAICVNFHVLEYASRCLRFNSALLHSIEKLFSKTIEASNTAIFALDASAQDSQAHANSKQILQSGGGFQNQVVSPTNSSDQNLLTSIRDQISNDVFELMGVLSVGDVVKQRIITTAQIADQTHELVNSFKKEMSETGELIEPQEKISEAIKTSEKFFTNEMDKKIFHSIFYHRN